eukprot:365122-Chlamydomonas_euryale.AAC.53
MKLNSSPHSTVPLCAREMLEVRKRDGRVFITQYSSLPLVTSADNSRTLSAPFGGFASPKLGMIGNDMALGSTINWFRACIGGHHQLAQGLHWGTPSAGSGPALGNTISWFVELRRVKKRISGRPWKWPGGGSLWLWRAPTAPMFGPCGGEDRNWG